MPAQRYLIGILLVLFTHGCGGLAHRLHGPPTMAPEAGEWVRVAGSFNPALETLKGIGNVRLLTSEGARSARMAWALEQPAQLRIQILGFTGQPIQSLAFNGKRIFLVSHLDRRYYSKRQRNPSLARMIGIDIHAMDVVELLRGRPPMPPFRKAALERNADDGSTVLVLTGRTFVQKMVLDPAGDRVTRVERFDKTGNLVYRATIDAFRPVGDFLLPARLTLANAHHDGLIIDIERCWPNAAMDADLFMLTRPL